MSSKLGKTITKTKSKQLTEKYLMLNEQQSTNTKQKHFCKLYHPECLEVESDDFMTKNISKRFWQSVCTSAFTVEAPWPI